MDLAFWQLQGLWQRPLAGARRAPHLTDGYGWCKRRAVAAWRGAH
jgi:hypothetical protein